MSTHMQRRSDRFERIARGLLGLALIAGVAWALMHGATPGSGPALPLG